MEMLYERYCGGGVGVAIIKYVGEPLFYVEYCCDSGTYQPDTNFDNLFDAIEYADNFIF